MKDLGIIPAHAQLSAGHPSVQDWDKLQPAQRQLELKRMRVYAAMIENMDLHIGRLTKALNERDTDRETVIIFFSDNGAEGNAIDGILDNRYWIPANFDNRYENLGRKGSFLWLGHAGHHPQFERPDRQWHEGRHSDDPRHCADYSRTRWRRNAEWLLRWQDRSSHDGYITT
jgi:arylsulfatase A-like enzyme